MYKIIFLTIILLNSITSLFGQKVNGNISPIFDISADEKNLIVSISEEHGTFIYKYSFDKKKLKKLTKEKNSYHSRPMYSPDGNKIIFLSKQLEKEISQISILDLKTNKIKVLKTGEAYVTEAIFYPDGEKIIFCASTYIGNYSPMAKKAPHDIDIYTINIDGTDMKKITDFNAYSLSSISLNNSGTEILFNATVKDNFDGIYLMSLSDTSIIQKIEAINNPRPQIGNSFYSNPNYSKNDKSISFTAPYQLYTLDLGSKECKEVWSTFGKDSQAMVISSKFFNSNNKIIFTILKIENRKYTRNALFRIIDLNTNKITNVKIK